MTIYRDGTSTLPREIAPGKKIPPPSFFFTYPLKKEILGGQLPPPFFFLKCPLEASPGHIR